MILAELGCSIQDPLRQLPLGKVCDLPKFRVAHRRVCTGLQGLRRKVFGGFRRVHSSTESEDVSTLDRREWRPVAQPLSVRARFLHHGAAKHRA